MPFNIFGLTIGKTRKAEKEEQAKKSFVLQDEADGAITIETGLGFFSTTYLDLEGSGRSDYDQIITYRELSLNPEIDSAIEDIINEAIVFDEGKPIVQLNLEDVTLPGPEDGKAIKEKIHAEFDLLLRLLKFQTRGLELFRRWYIDGKLYHHMVMDGKDTTKGILEIRSIDPLTVRKIREVQRELDNETGVEMPRVVDEYYIYNEQGFLGIGGPGGPPAATLQGARISVDSVSFIHSGLVIDVPSSRQTIAIPGKFRTKRVLGYLHKALKPMNQLRLLEDAVVIYRISRAPERRVFYIDVGSLPKVKAEQYLKDIMNRYRNKLVYDATTGEIRDQHRHFSMLEDFWLPRREGGKGTEITTLEGAKNLGEMQDVEFFLKKLYKALNVPLSRLDPNQGVQGLGRTSQITHDELKFSKFVNKLRNKFSELFLTLLRTQLVSKKILTDTDWNEIIEDVRFSWARDSHFSELKDAEVLRERLDLLTAMALAIEAGFYSKAWARKNILQQTDEEVALIEKQSKKEMKERAKELEQKAALGIPDIPLAAAAGIMPAVGGALGSPGAEAPPTQAAPPKPAKEPAKPKKKPTKESWEDSEVTTLFEGVHYRD